MAQRAKQWLRRKGNNSFNLDKKEGGFAGSLRGLGYLIREENGRYRITVKGEKWLSPSK